MLLLIPDLSGSRSQSGTSAQTTVLPSFKVKALDVIEDYHPWIQSREIEGEVAGREGNKA